MATTRRELEGIVRRINLMTGNPTEPYSRVGDRNVANIGNYHLDGAYGGWALHQMMSEGGGIRAVISGYRPKAELATLMFAFINGLETAEAMEPDRPPLKRRGAKGNPAPRRRRRSPQEVKAAKRGEQAGKGAASWRFDGNTTDETYRRALKGMEEGDPEILDVLNQPDWLSGQWAGESINELLGDLLGADEDKNQEIEQAYEDAASQAFYAELERVARYHVGGRNT